MKANNILLHTLRGVSMETLQSSYSIEIVTREDVYFFETLTNLQLLYSKAAGMLGRTWSKISFFFKHL